MLRYLIVVLCARVSTLGAQTGLSTQMVVVDGAPVRVQLAGLDARRAGQPIVIFEAGGTQGSEAWADIPSSVASQAPVLAYDRAGLGRSVWDNVAPQPAHVVGRLRRLLEVLDIAPPYLLVGYSWGGMLAHYFAGRYPDAVTGLVLVDPAPLLTLSFAEHLAPFDSVGAGRVGFDAYWTGFTGLVARAAPGARAEFAVFRDLLTADMTARDMRPLPAVPLTVLVAGKYLPVPSVPVPYDPARHFAVDLRQRLRELERWVAASPHGTLVLASHATHAIPREDPELIVWAIRRVLAAARQ